MYASPIHIYTLSTYISPHPPPSTFPPPSKPTWPELSTFLMPTSTFLSLWAVELALSTHRHRVAMATFRRTFQRFIIMEISALPDEGGGARPPPFTISAITYTFVVYAPAERANTVHPPYLLYPYMYSVELATRVPYV
jgi:hypothetical protein